MGLSSGDRSNSNCRSSPDRDCMGEKENTGYPCASTEFGTRHCLETLLIIPTFGSKFKGRKEHFQSRGTGSTEGHYHFWVQGRRGSEEYYQLQSQWIRDPS